MTVSSWSCPIVLPPFDSSTPMTLNGKFLIRTVWSIGFWSPKSDVATVAPSTATFAADRTSESPKKLPFSTFHDRTKGHSTPTPWTDVPQFRLPATTWPADRAIGDTYATEGHSLRTAVTSSSVMLDCPVKIRAPDWVDVPGKTMRKFVPSEEICA